MTDDRAEISRLIEGWATAVHVGDLQGVLADHSDDIVMFDVPPPHEGVRGIANRLRVTLGLRKDQGRWVVTHEHHSFPDTPGRANATARLTCTREETR